MSRSVLAAIAASIFPFASLAIAAPTTFVIDDPGKHNNMSFESRAPLETVPGSTQDVTGTITFDPENLTDAATGSVVVSAATLTTGIAKRDEHMKGEKFLDTGKYPSATFVLEKIVSSDKPKIADGEAAQLVLAGKLTIHGVTREVQAPATLIYKKAAPELAQMGYPGEIASVRTAFDVKLADYGIERPQMLIMKLEDTVHISLQYTAASGRQKA